MRRARLAGLTCLALATLLSTGCSRAYWRRNADAEAYGLIREKTRLDARWAPPRSDVIPNPLSRLYDPADPDFGSLPPDDPYANRYMHAMSDCDRIHGSAYWDKIGMGNSIENPAWVASLPPDVLPGPLLAEQVGKDDDSEPHQTDAEPKPLPFAERFAMTETLRSWREKIGFSTPAPAGRATVATADVSTRTTGKTSNAPSAVASTAKPQAGAVASKPVWTSGSTRNGIAARAKAAKPNANPFAKPAGGEIQLTAFQEVQEDATDPPLTIPRSSESIEPNPFSTDPDVAPRELAVPAPPTEIPNAKDSLSAEPADPDTAVNQPVGPDLATANPALPPVEKLTLEEAVRLSYLHSREYQTTIEDVYLAAMDLAFDRFQFDVRFLGIGRQRPSSDLSYSGTPGGAQSLTATNRFGISRLLPAGGQWVVELANQTLWLFSDGPNESGTASTLSYSFIQPLLFAAGRKVVLENLTQSERNLLYAARDLARFRQVFFVATVTGNGGYLGLLQQIQSIANQEDNIRRLEDQLAASQADELRSDPLSRTQLESQQLGRITALRNSRRALQDQLDNYKIQLGLPPDLFVSIDTKLLAPFQLISSELLELESTTDIGFRGVWATISQREATPESLRRGLDSLGPIFDDIRDVAIPQVDEDFRRVEENLPRRLAALPEPKAEARERIAKNAKSDRGFFEYALSQFETRRTEFEGLQRDIDAATVVAASNALITDAADAEAAQSALTENLQTSYARIDVLQENMLRLVRNLQTVQVGLRTELIELNPFEMAQSEAIGFALTNRVDLMNQRALVTDARRRVEVSANALRAVLNVRVDGDIRTPTVLNNDNPFNFRRTSSNFRAGINFVAPLDQITQRNAYRVSQITYQRVRRSYMETEDRVKFAVRQDWRQLAVLKQNFEVSRYALRVAAQQYDLAVEKTADPRTGTGNQSAGTAGLSLISALNSVLTAQNQLIQTWVDYESARLNIYRDMGIMEVDARGMWVDPFYQNGMTVPVGDVQGPPGWNGPSDVTEGPTTENGGPGMIPPAPAAPSGVQTEGTGPSTLASASKSAALRSASPAESGVRTAAYTDPPGSPLRKAGHERTEQPPVTGRTKYGDGNPARSPARTGKPGWRAAETKKE